MIKKFMLFSTLVLTCTLFAASVYANSERVRIQTTPTEKGIEVLLQFPEGLQTIGGLKLQTYTPRGDSVGVETYANVSTDSILVVKGNALDLLTIHKDGKLWMFLYIIPNIATFTNLSVDYVVTPAIQDTTLAVLDIRPSRLANVLGKSDAVDNNDSDPASTPAPVAITNAPASVTITLPVSTEVESQQSHQTNAVSKTALADTRDRGLTSTEIIYAIGITTIIIFLMLTISCLYIKRSEIHKSRR